MARNNSRRLEISTKLEILKFLDSGKSQRETAKKFDVAQSTVNNINKDRQFIHEKLEIGPLLDRCRKIRKIEINDINILVWNWFKKMRENDIPLLGSNIKEAAIKFAKKLGIFSFKASNGWFESFKKRYAVCFKVFDKKSLASDLIDDILNENRGEYCGTEGLVDSKEGEDSCESSFGDEEDRGLVGCEESVGSSQSSFDSEEDGVSSYSDALKNINALEKFFIGRELGLCKITNSLSREILNRGLKQSKDEGRISGGGL